jgi:enoyl-CoA hydratase/carnithine racemase
MIDPHVQLARRDGVLWIEFARRDKKNCLSTAMYAAVCDALNEAAADPAVRVAVLRGQEDMFTAGNDLNDFRTPGARAAGQGKRFLETIASFPKPLLAAVGGLAIGVGTTMLLHCDMVIAAEGTRFRLPFVPLGVCPEAASSLLLPLMAGPRLASELLLLGDDFNAQTAREAGIVNRVVPPEALMATVEALALRLAAMPTDAVVTTKALMKGPAGRTVRGVIEEERPHFERLVQSPEAQAAFAAFFERKTR